MSVGVFGRRGRTINISWIRECNQKRDKATDGISNMTVSKKKPLYRIDPSLPSYTIDHKVIPESKCAGFPKRPHLSPLIPNSTVNFFNAVSIHGNPLALIHYKVSLACRKGIGTEPSSCFFLAIVCERFLRDIACQLVFLRSIGLFQISLFSVDAASSELAKLEDDVL